MPTKHRLNPIAAATGAMPVPKRTKRDLPVVPPALEDAALIDGPTCAAVGCISVSQWHEDVRTGRAPQPVIRGTRCTRWRLVDIRHYWISRAEQVSDGDAAELVDRATRASAKAAEKRQQRAAAGA